MNNVVSRLKYIYSIHNPIIRKLSHILKNNYQYKIEILIFSSILLIVFLMYFIEHVKYLKTKKQNTKENKLFLLTQFNTLLNKMMPIDIESFGRSTYLKILGDDFTKIYPRIFNKENKSKNKKNNHRVSFDENNINFMI
jgi:membrane-associated HD superfamily phosphohydrolase